MKKRGRTLIFLTVFILCMTGMVRLSGAEPENSVQTDETADSASDNRLSSLRIAQAVLSPEFSPEQLTYTASVPYNVTRIALTADTRSGQAKKVISGTGDLAVGENTVTIVVTAQDGSVREYRVTVIREEAEGGEGTTEEPPSSEETTEASSETGDEPVTESSPAETPSESQAEEPAGTPSESQAGEPVGTQAESQTGEPVGTQAESQTGTPAASQTEEPAGTQAGAAAGFQTVADSQKTGDGRLFGMNPLVLILSVACLLLLFVIVAVLLLRRELGDEEEDEEDDDEDFEGEDKDIDEADAYDDGIDEEEDSDGYDDGREPAGYEEDAEPADRSGNIGSGRGGSDRERKHTVRDRSAKKDAEKAGSAKEDTAGTVTPEELARFYRALNLEEEALPASASEDGSVSDDLDEDLEILDLDEEAPVDVSRSGIEKDDDFDFLDL